MMEDTNKVVESTQSDNDDDLPPGQSSSVILENPTSEMIKEISTYFQASQCMLGNSSEESLVTAADSESIEHPILTQVPVSRARRYRRSTRSEATTASEESGGESASSVSQPARSSARRKHLKGRNKGAFQAFRSPFFEGNSFNKILPSLKMKPFSNIQQEAKVKTSAVGGFFKCIRLWHRVNLKRYVRATCLPALYMDADESLSPLSEGNETSDEEGIKVVSNDFFVKSRKGQCPRGRAPAKGVRGRCTGPVEERGSQAKTGRTGDGAKRARGPGTQPVDGTASRATLRRTSPRTKGVRGLGAGTGSHDKNGPSSSPHPAPPGEEWSTASSQPEDHLGFESAAGYGAMVEESSGQVLEKDPTSDVTPVQQVTPPPEMPCTGDNISAGNRQPDVVRDSVCRSPDLSKTKTCETNESKKIISERVEVAVECAPGVPDQHENNTDEQHRKRKGRKKEKGGKFTEGEGNNISLDGPGQASQPTSGSDMIINNDQNLNPLGDQLEDLWRRKKISKKKKPSTDGVITEGEVNVVDTASTDETSTLTEPTAVGFKKQRRKKDKMVPCSEDPEPIPASGYTEGGNPFKHPADRGVALEDDTSEASDFSQRTLGSAMSINNDDVVLEHTRRKKKKKEKKHKVTEDEEIHMSSEGPCPALETSDISQSGSAMTTNNDDDDQHRKRKKRKKEKKCRVPEDEEINMSLDGPCPALETSDISQLTSESAMTINNNDDDEEHRKRKKRKKEKKPRFPEEEEINVSLDGPCPAVEPSDVSQGTSDSGTTINNNNWDDEHRKTKKRKKENKRKVASGEEINIPLDAPCPALDTFDVSKRTSESTMTINSNHSLDCAGDQLEDMLKPRKKSKKKKLRTNGVVTEGELKVADTASTHETSTLAETTAGFKKGKSKKDKIAPCREDPERNPEADNMEGEHCSFKHPADGEVECQRKKRRKQKMSETTRHAICEDTLVRGSGLTSAREKTRKRHHSFLSDDAMENPPKTNKISTCDVDTEPVENGETLMESLIAKTKKKKKCEGSVLNVRSSAETGNDTVRKKKKKMKDKADRESESPVMVHRETPDDIETTVLIKKKKCKKNTRPPSQGSTPAEARDESGVTTPTDSVAVSPRRCSSVVDTDATQAGNAAIPTDGATVKKKTGRKRQKNTSGVGTCDSDVPEQNIRTTTEPIPHWTPETESRLKKKKNKKKDGRVMDRMEAATDPGTIEAQHSGHEAEVTSQDAVPPESRTQNHHESSSPRRYKKKALKRKPLFNQGQDFLDTEPILT
ncbi:phoenix isoform X1 [Gadus macrocephalus]|uniref:phoenix isoform X1 n=2 Tax=Gadus macrocephalus TaxID=80720 RepID=UPI0028CB8597|nr:phoenix isoform X1 [Gadus macrocephalus]